MPTIEIICLEQESSHNFGDLSFALFSEDEVITHRGLFYDELKLLKGCIYHLGNPGMRDLDLDGCWAGQLLTWLGEGFLQFKPEFVGEVQMVVETLLEDSPINQLIFLSDYQFGPPTIRRYQRPLTLQTFWQKHDAEKLWMNARYFLKK
jgi:hypothetical protein